MIFSKKILLAVMLSFGLVACAQNGFNGVGGMGTKQTVGAGTGAVAGAVIGSNIGDGKGAIAATAVGTLLGAFLGSEVGKSLDRADMAYAQQAQQRAYAAPIGETISWNNPESGNRGTFTPVRDGYRNSGEYCREYNQTIFVDGRTETATGTACQKPDGTWSIIN